MIKEIIKLFGGIILEGYYYGTILMILAIPVGLIIKGIIMIV